MKTLYAKIGELTLERDFLSAALGKAGLLQRCVQAEGNAADDVSMLLCLVMSMRKARGPSAQFGLRLNINLRSIPMSLRLAVLTRAAEHR